MLDLPVLAPSLLSADFSNLAEDIKKIDFEVKKFEDYELKKRKIERKIKKVSFIELCAEDYKKLSFFIYKFRSMNNKKDKDGNPIDENGRKLNIKEGSKDSTEAIYELIVIRISDIEFNETSDNNNMSSYRKLC